VSKDGSTLGEITLNIPGRHNAVNALAAVALASELGQSFESIATALESFRGAKRRFEIVHESPRQTIVDDYGHHPTEIAATLATARTGGHGRVIAMFQPHRYTRTQALKEEFGKAFGGADHVFISDIDPASEKPIPGISGEPSWMR
jgi:UDP-N-acetylmuramate-alanine ligase